MNDSDNDNNRLALNNKIDTIGETIKYSPADGF